MAVSLVYDAMVYTAQHTTQRNTHNNTVQHKLIGQGSYIQQQNDF